MVFRGGSGGWVGGWVLFVLVVEVVKVRGVFGGDGRPFHGVVG